MSRGHTVSLSVMKRAGALYHRAPRAEERTTVAWYLERMDSRNAGFPCPLLVDSHPGRISEMAQQGAPETTRSLKSFCDLDESTLLDRCSLLIELPAHLEPPRVIRSRQIAKWPRPHPPVLPRSLPWLPVWLLRRDLANTSCILFLHLRPYNSV